MPAETEIIPLENLNVAMYLAQLRGLMSQAQVYSMIGAFPTAIAPIELGWDTNDALEEFSVTWAFSWWETKDTTFDASGTGALAAKIKVDTPLGDFSGSMSFGKG